MNSVTAAENMAELHAAVRALRTAFARTVAPWLSEPKPPLTESQKRLLAYFTGPTAGLYQRPRIRQALREARDSGDWHGELRLLLDLIDREHPAGLMGRPVR